ncbi:hypothetical protein LJY25_08315 [Hymenobacter sp. BT175]|uniref:hypothetical protein n=1 Tax=Hymenobacter translucens TaxID=2886507 RepID=UPI001D0EF170|nr:hypothetical protein [Hymenobacter translucens]MCC2546445.1 hypothetical protein [Hymenobacter translucens]
MEALRTQGPTGPRNLYGPVATLLHSLGFEVWEQPRPTASMSLVTGWWEGGGCRFIFQYAHHHPAQEPGWGGCSLAVQEPSSTGPPQDCFTMTQVRRLREVRLLLLQNERFAQARATKQAFSTTAKPSAPCPSMPTK